ncbi:MAG: hypothetical protein WCU88_04235 [Elusimicrobiota bacterium]|jgi:hypothetical protein
MSAKKNKKKSSGPLIAPDGPREEESLSKRGWKTLLSGIGLLVLGFVVLSFTDPMGRNWASRLSPFLILGAYCVIAAGILLPEPSPEPAKTLEAGSERTQLPQ